MKRFDDIVTMTDDLHLTTRTASRSGCSDPASSFVVGSTESEARGSTARQKLQAVMLEPSSWLAPSAVLANVNFFLVNLLNSVVFYRLLCLLQLDVAHDSAA